MHAPPTLAEISLCPTGRVCVGDGDCEDCDLDEEEQPEVRGHPADGMVAGLTHVGRFRQVGFPDLRGAESRGAGVGERGESVGGEWEVEGGGRGEDVGRGWK